MSFVARRFGSAGLVPLAEESGVAITRSSTREDGVADERRTCPAPIESGITLRAPLVLVVGVDDDVARMCMSLASRVEVGFVRVSQGIAASRAIRDTRPTVVGIAHSLWRDEKAAIAEAARQVGARMLELPPFAPKDWVAAKLVKAAMMAETQLDETG